MKIKTSELVGPALDWAVAKCEGQDIEIVPASRIINISGEPPAKALAYPKGGSLPFIYTHDWDRGGPIIEREGISTIRCDDDYETDSKGFTTNKRIPVWGATLGQHSIWETTSLDRAYEIYADNLHYGPTPLIAAMRCYVASKLGEEIEIPDELRG